MRWNRARNARVTRLPVGAFALAFAGSFLYFSLADGDGRGARPRDAPAEGGLVVTFSAAADEPGKGYLARVALDGSVARMLLEPPGGGGLASHGRPPGSPGGTTVAFSRAVGGRFDLFAGASDGSALTRLTHTRGLDELSPAWSPDGSRIVFARYE